MGAVVEIHILYVEWDRDALGHASPRLVREDVRVALTTARNAATAEELLEEA